MANSGSYVSSSDTRSIRLPFTPPLSFTSWKAARIPSLMPLPSSCAGPLKAADWPNSTASSVTPGVSVAETTTGGVGVAAPLLVGVTSAPLHATTAAQARIASAFQAVLHPDANAADRVLYSIRSKCATVRGRCSIAPHSNSTASGEAVQDFGRRIQHLAARGQRPTPHAQSPAPAHSVRVKWRVLQGRRPKHHSPCGVSSVGVSFQ